ncbi:segregation/condensation protein A [Gammaproteobacteria bacterium]|nr:segregation/condensation protein A [Gammaproteobacteria bacterium]
MNDLTDTDRPPEQTPLQHPLPNTAQPGQVIVNGGALQQWPRDLYIPPDALEVFLETFEGPLDLLLYLIRKQNLDILDIPVAEVTRQYMAYIEHMRAVKLDLAAEYLLMAATLAEIKSRLLLPRHETEEDEEDPRAALVRRLQEYERFREASMDLGDRPRVDRDIFVAWAPFVDLHPPAPVIRVALDDLAAAFQSVVEEAERFQHLHIDREVLSVRERMSIILNRLQEEEFVRFESLFIVREGRKGLVVTFVAILELIKEEILFVVQNEPFAPIHVRTAV